AQEMEALAEMERDGLVALRPGKLEVLPKGRLLVRHVAMAFDAYLRTPRAKEMRFSKVI
ncbi:MAG: coproporphyrinogen III oxidase, partial [Zetaproteobacteria bacterium]